MTAPGSVLCMALDPNDPGLVAFWSERHLCTLSTLRADGSPHVVPVGVTYDPEARLARIITRATSQKVRNLEQAALTGDAGGSRVAVCQIDGARWSTLEGGARVSHDPDEIAESVRRYAVRYRQPRDNPTRVTILIDVSRVLGHL